MGLREDKILVGSGHWSTEKSRTTAIMLVSNFGIQSIKLVTAARSFRCFSGFDAIKLGLCTEQELTDFAFNHDYYRSGLATVRKSGTEAEFSGFTLTSPSHVSDVGISAALKESEQSDWVSFTLQKTPVTDPADREVFNRHIRMLSGLIPGESSDKKRNLHSPERKASDYLASLRGVEAIKKATFEDRALADELWGVF